MRQSIGITLTELLIALVIFASVFAISSTGIVNALRGQTLHDANVSAQSKLRRINEIVNQEFRGAAMGGISKWPYASDANSLSIIRLTGGAGYSVSTHLTTSSQLDIIANTPNASDLDLLNSQVLVLNGQGNAMLMNIKAVTKQSDFKFRLTYATCSNAIVTDANTLLFAVETIGYRLDTNTETLYRRRGTASEIPVAFDVSKFNLGYIYESSSGAKQVLSTPLLIDGTTLPAKKKNGLTLSGINVSLETSEKHANQDVNKSFGNYVNLITEVDNLRVRTFQGVEICG